ncbi:hypothetical protein DI43_19050 [Geobacillus sp. CAMR12739]|nr:hypothetical protein DI43_19050 [Geobacillus sp. CAMR12739]
MILNDLDRKVFPRSYGPQGISNIIGIFPDSICYLFTAVVLNKVEQFFNGFAISSMSANVNTAFLRAAVLIPCVSTFGDTVLTFATEGVSCDTVFVSAAKTEVGTATAKTDRAKTGDKILLNNFIDSFINSPSLLSVYLFQ